jgi:uncharacterized protein
LNEPSADLSVASSLYEAFRRVDAEALLALLDRDVDRELVGPDEIPYFGIYRGVEEVRRFLEAWRS